MVPWKGIILTALSVFWFKLLETYGFKHHMVAYGSGIDEYLPPHLRGNIDLQCRAMVVKNLDMVDDTEFIYRGNITGSGLEEYDENGTICGHVLPKGLKDGDELICPLDTPSSKAKVGHDEHVPAAEIQQKYPLQTYLGLQIYLIMRAVAKACGIVLADTKFEFAKDGTIGDEVGTPDSSRFWDWVEWLFSHKAEKRKAPTSKDKQFVRAWGILMGINKKDKYDAKNPEDHKRVHKLVVPKSVITMTTLIYRYIFWRLTKKTIEQFSREVMNVNLPVYEPKKVLIVCGSKSDVDEVKAVCEGFGPDQLLIKMIVMSCHRNPEQTRAFMKKLKVGEYDMLIGIGSKALALPGILASWAHCFKKQVRIAGVALGKSATKGLEAAKLSIDELPGQPVIMNELTDEVYSGAMGLSDLLYRIESGELPTLKPMEDKPVEDDVWNNYDHLTSHD